MRFLTCALLLAVGACSPEFDSFGGADSQSLQSNLDWDGDGVDDRDLDNCPQLANPMVPLERDDLDGCAAQKFGLQAGDMWQPDLDCDGIGDACDEDADNDGWPRCGLQDDPEENPPECESALADRDFENQPGGAPPRPRDDDRDAVVNEEDNCPNHPNADQADFDADGIGDACDDDVDGDGVADLPDAPEDMDGDGWTPEQGDCNDFNADINPGANEICDNGVDENCNGQINEICEAVCHPDFGGELCGDGIDNDCNGVVDDDCQPCDTDDECGLGGGVGCWAGRLISIGNTGACRFGVCEQVQMVFACPFGCDSEERFEECSGMADWDGDGFSQDEGDCNDGDHKINPGMGDPCDNIDNNCDGVVDNNELRECIACDSSAQCPQNGDEPVTWCTDEGNEYHDGGGRCNEDGWCEISDRITFCRYGCLDDNCVEPRGDFLAACTILTCENEPAPNLQEALECEDFWTELYLLRKDDERQICKDFVNVFNEMADCIGDNESCAGMADGRMSAQCGQLLSDVDRLDRLADEARCGLVPEFWPFDEGVYESFCEMAICVDEGAPDYEEAVAQQMCDSQRVIVEHARMQEEPACRDYVQAFESAIHCVERYSCEEIREDALEDGCRAQGERWMSAQDEAVRAGCFDDMAFAEPVDFWNDYLWAEFCSEPEAPLFPFVVEYQAVRYRAGMALYRADGREFCSAYADAWEEHAMCVSENISCSDSANGEEQGCAESLWELDVLRDQSRDYGYCEGAIQEDRRRARRQECESDDQCADQPVVCVSDGDLEYFFSRVTNGCGGDGRCNWSNHVIVCENGCDDDVGCL